MNIHSRSFLYGVFGVLALMVPVSVHAADINFSPSSDSHPAGKTFTMTVAIDPGGDKVNAADGIITFDKDILTVVGVSKDGSAFSLWTSDPTFSNADGTINFSGGSPAAFSTKGTVLTVSFKGNTKGSGKVSMSKGSILAADGKGTDVYKNGGSATFDIGDAAAPPPPEEPAPVEDTGPPEPGAPVPIAPVINSPTHPKPDSWYATSTAIFNWKPTSDVIGMRIMLSDKDNLSPTTTVKGVPTTQSYTGLKDGVWFLYVQYKNDIGWGAIGKQKFQIDTVAPKEFDVALIEKPADGSPPKLSFQTEDTLSGIDRYEILLGSTTAATAHPGDLVSGTFPVPPQEGGSQEVTIRAYDKAGNMAQAKRTMTLPAVAKPKAKGEADVPVVPVWTAERLFIILLALIIGGLLMRGYYATKAAVDTRAKTLQTILDLRDKNDRVFSAMREEFEKLINDYDAKPQLTPEERKLLEDIKEVLDIAEGVIDTTIEELKKEVRGS